MKQLLVKVKREQVDWKGAAMMSCSLDRLSEKLKAWLLHLLHYLLNSHFYLLKLLELRSYLSLDSGTQILDFVLASAEVPLRLIC